MEKKTLICESCGAVKFEIIVEPDLPSTEDQKCWIRDAVSCPHCGTDTREED